MALSRHGRTADLFRAPSSNTPAWGGQGHTFLHVVNATPEMLFNSTPVKVET